MQLWVYTKSLFVELQKHWTGISPKSLLLNPHFVTFYYGIEFDSYWLLLQLGGMCSAKGCCENRGRGWDARLAGAFTMFVIVTVKLDCVIWDLYWIQSSGALAKSILSSYACFFSVCSDHISNWGCYLDFLHFVDLVLTVDNNWQERAKSLKLPTHITIDAGRTQIAPSEFYSSCPFTNFKSLCVC